jgi:hypothetical protein
MDFHFSVNLDQISEQLRQKRELVEGVITEEIKKLSIATHAFVTNFANERLEGFKREAFFGKNNNNVRWQEISPGMWVVEIDESSRWVEEGRESVFMDWLLKGPNAKTAKDGSRYAVIPMGQARGAGGKKPNKEPFLQAMIQGALKREGISLNRLDKGPDGKPKLGILSKLHIEVAHRTEGHAPFFSKPRTPEMAAQVNLKPHSGHFFLKNAVVMQREIHSGGRKRVSKEVVTFRVISSKHREEGRWFYPKVEPLNSIPEAYKWAESEWEHIVKSLEEQFNKTGES